MDSLLHFVGLCYHTAPELLEKFISTKCLNVRHNESGRIAAHVLQWLGWSDVHVQAICKISNHSPIPQESEVQTPRALRGKPTAHQTRTETL